jgi:MoaA/NifB/PqqE/SkfB family radical SAM enzyme
MPLESVTRLLPSLAQLQTQVVLLSGGEPLLNPEWAATAQLLRANGLQVWLLTSGLSLAKHAQRAAELFDAITVSLDGTDAKTYAAIRGLDAFDKVCEGIRAAADHGASPSIRVTLQRANYRQLPKFVVLGKELGAREVSFLAVDVANSEAFGRAGNFASDLALRSEDLPVFDRLLGSLERDHTEDFRSGFIAENPQKLRRILQYFAAIHGRGSYPQVRCNAPEFSAVIGAAGRVQPCFFIPGPPDARLASAAERGGAAERGDAAERGGAAERGVAAETSDAEFTGVLNGESMSALRADIRAGMRTECKTCICSMWRDPSTWRDAPLFGGSALAARLAAETSA